MLKAEFYQKDNCVLELGRIMKKYLRLPFKINSYAIFIERLLMKKKYQCIAPQLFIMGLPRTGTTLIYQYIIHRLHVSYFTNGVGIFPVSPCITTFIQRKVYGQYQSDFRSNYGKVLGTVAPREAGGFWCRFFDINSYVSFDDLTEKDVYLLRNTIACIQNIFGGVPFVNKNVKHLLRIGALSKIFPNSQFLIVERDMADVAISVLRGRYKNLSDPRQWWSVRPPNYEKLKNLPIVDQVFYQCVSLKEKMEEDISSLSGKRIIRIHYEKFSDNPEELIRKLIVSLNATETGNPPQSHFEISHNEVQNEEERRLIGLLRKTYK